MIPWKIVGFSGLLGALLSLLVAVISGVGFGSALLRALVLGLTFAGLSVVLSIIIKRFLPELLEIPESETEKNNAGGEPEGIDIILPGEDPEIKVYTSSDEDADFLDTAEEGEGDTTGEEGTDNPFKESAYSSLPSPMHPSREDETDFSSPEKLPSMENFMGTFPSENLPGGSREREKLDSIATDNNPAILAKAIQTMLKKDQKG